MSERKEVGPFEYIDYFKRASALMVTIDKKGKPNVMALDWKKLFTWENQPVIRAQVAYSRYTYECLMEGAKGEFTINIPSDKIAHAVNIAGFSSGRNTDKFKDANLEIIPGKLIQVPTIKDSLLNYECRVIYDEKSNINSHHYFYGKILVTYASIKL
ncbi:MAG: flavin reductase family protein [Promethearchaeota archaeon]